MNSQAQEFKKNPDNGNNYEHLFLNAYVFCT